MYCVKSVHIRSFSGPYFPAFRLNMEKYSVSLRIQSERGKIRTRRTLNTDIFYAVMLSTFKHFIDLQVNYPPPQSQQAGDPLLVKKYTDEESFLVFQLLAQLLASKNILSLDKSDVKKYCQMLSGKVLSSSFSLAL